MGPWSILHMKKNVIRLIAGLLLCSIFGFEISGVGRYPHTVVIDPGHGEPDGGAIASDGTCENEINLALATRVTDILRLFYVPCVQTRTDPVGIWSEDCTTIREKKVSDIHRRVEITMRQEKPFLISVHQNSFIGKASGAQVYFGNVPDSVIFAEELSAALQGTAQVTVRDPVPVPDHVYLFSHCDCPGILVECGFLSDPGDLALLKSPHHQEILALSISFAYLSFAFPKEEV